MEEKSTPVIITDTEKPVSVVVEQPKPHYVKTKAGKQVLAPETTEEQNINTAGQRKINLVWEYTQAAIALTVTVFTMAASLLIVIEVVVYNRTELQLPTIFAVAFGTVIGFYFSRTNHEAIGGVGSKPRQPYRGR